MGREKGFEMDEAAKQKMRDSWTPERREAMSKLHKGKTISEERKQQISDTHLGVPKTEDQKRKMSLAKVGVKKSEEHKKAMSEASKKAWAEGKHEDRPLLTCPSCGKQSKQNRRMARDHFENCPYKGL